MSTQTNVNVDRLENIIFYAENLVSQPVIRLLPIWIQTFCTFCFQNIIADDTAGCLLYYMYERVKVVLFIEEFPPLL